MNNFWARTVFSVLSLVVSVYTMVHNIDVHTFIERIACRFCVRLGQAPTQFGQIKLCSASETGLYTESDSTNVS